MSLIRYEPTRNFFPISSVLNRVFDDFFPGFFGNSELPTVTFRPTVDIVEQEDKVIVKADMPGLDKGDVKVVVNDGLLTIEGTRKEARDESKKGFVRCERFVGTFSRSFNLPAWADASKLSANYKNGVLEVTIPKTEAARPKEVEIKIG